MSFNPENLLPKNIIIPFAQTHLYRIGLSLFPYEFIKRKRYNNPLFIFIIHLFILIRSIIALNLSDNNDFMLLVIGDYSHFLKIRIQFNLAVALISSLPLISQIIHYYNFKNDIKPSYLRPFEMISGLISPKSIGLTDKEQIYDLIKQSKTLFICCEFMLTKVIPLMGFSMGFLTFSLNCSLIELIVYCIPHCILVSSAIYSGYSIILWQLIYYYIICQYLKSKLK